MNINRLPTIGLEVTSAFFAFRCDDQVVCWQMERAGCGIGFDQFGMSDTEPRVRRVSGDVPVARLPVWLTAHPEMRTTLRVRRAFNRLAAVILS